MTTPRNLALSAQLVIACAAFAAATLPSIAQTAATDSSTETPPTQEQAVRMSVFEVRTTQGQGYSEGNAASALKGDAALMDLPQQIIVVSSDMIKDIGAANSSDVLLYAGIGTYYRGPAIQSRGSRIGNPYVDDVNLAVGSITDDVNIDAYEVVKGPMQMLYPGASLGGIVLETSKKPLPGVNQYIITAQVNQWGGHRETFDLNGPVGTLGDGNLTFRIVGAYQSPKQIFKDVEEQRENIYPDLEWDWHQTTLIFSYDTQLWFYLPGGTSMLNPQGGLYTGDGRRVEGAPPNDQDRYEAHDERVAWLQKLSDHWESKLQVLNSSELRYGVSSYIGTVNWNTNRAGYVIRLDDQWSDYYVIQDDFNGKYDIGPIHTQSQFGFNHTEDNVAPDYYPTYTDTIPIGSPAAINAIVLPNSFAGIPSASTTLPSRQETYIDNGYFMQSADIVPNWLTVVGGLTFSKIESINDTNINVANPYSSTDENGHDLLHRIGAILHLTKEIMLYAEESTTYSTSAGLTYLNTPLPLVQGKSDEVGIKTNFLDNKISTSFAVYKMSLTNQAILAPYPLLNIAGTNYYYPIGTTHYAGWDADVSLQLAPGWQLISAGYVGTVEDQNGNPVSQTYGNQWSVFTRYNFENDSALRGFGFGGGVNRQGARYFNMASLTLPGGTPPVTTGALYSGTPNSSGVALFKLHEGTMVNLFVSYNVNKHLQLLVNCENVLDQAYPLGSQGVGLVDPSDPTTFSFEMTYKF
jgi:iron complex outermembrane receptor protein